MNKFDTSSFADKILAASSLASEGLEGEVEFSFTDDALVNKPKINAIRKYAKEFASQGFTFDGYMILKSVNRGEMSDRSNLLKKGIITPMEEMVRTFLVFLSKLGKVEELLEFVLIHIKPRDLKIFYTQTEDSKDLDTLTLQRLKNIESEWVQKSKIGKELLSVCFLIENDNSYAIDIEKAEGPLQGKEDLAKKIMESVFRSRLKLVRNFLK
ncbi:hypothetical protein [[Eubacterium] cellulosolvens]